jgi:hypothetical protein
VGFDRNLARLRRRHARLADRVASSDAGPVAIERGPTGAVTLVENGLRLASAYDPAAEGRRLAAPIAAESPDLLVAVGLGTGHQLDALRAARPAPMVVYEPSLARWRALLAAREEIEWLDAPDVDCAADLDELSERFGARYASGLAVRTCVQPVVARLDAAIVHTALDRVAQVKRAADATAQTRVAMMRTWSEGVVDNAPRLLATPSFERLRGAFAGVPAVIAAAGPSLDRQLGALAHARERLLVIAIGQSHPALARAGIRADLVHAIESKDVSHQLEAGDPRDLALVVYPSSHPNLFAAPARARFVAYPEPYGIARWFGGALGDARFVPGGATVAQSAVHLAAALGARSIALVGQDLAFTGGRVYASGSAYEMVSFEPAEDGKFAFTNLAEKKALLGIEVPRGSRRTDDLVWVEGWDGAPVPTSRSYAAFLEHYRGIAAHLARQGVALVNCTEGGARIPGLAHEAFGDWIAAQPVTSVGCFERVVDAFDAAPRFGAEALDAPLAQARGALGRLEREARGGRAHAQRAARTRGAARSRKDVLRALSRSIERVKETLASIAWLDDVSQASLHAATVAARRAGAAEDAIDEATALIETTLESVASGRILIDRLVARLAAQECSP